MLQGAYHKAQTGELRFSLPVGYQYDQDGKIIKSRDEQIRHMIQFTFETFFEIGTLENRERRPPTDPVNALLSFGYTLLTNDMIAAVNIVGFDPYIGYLHTEEYGRPSLPLDLIEEFRPLT